MRRYFFILLFCFPSFSIAQSLKEFPLEPKAFFDVMYKFIQETNADEAEALMAELRVVWTSETLEPKEEEKLYKIANKYLGRRIEEGTLTQEYKYSSATARFTDAQKQNIIRTCNSMIKKRMKALPEFKNYLIALIGFQLSNQTVKSFNGWQESLDKLLEKQNKYFSSYIIGCNNLFTGNLLYISVSTRWVASNNDFTFDFDTLPKVVFKGLTLSCYAKKDSSVIHETEGVYYPTLQLWKGKGGKVNFKRGGLSEDEARATLSNYSIDVSGADYTADSVTFYFSRYFSTSLLGKYYDKILADVTVENASYPRFETYTRILEIKDIVKDVDYKGGFALQGKKIIGTGTNLELATLTFYLRKKPFLIASSHSFIVRSDKITSDRTAVTIYLDTTVCNPHCDSLYHSSVQLKYIVADRSLSLIRSAEGVGGSPFFDTFHKLDMYMEGLYWKIDDPVIQAKMLTGGVESKAHFETSSFYKDSKYDKLQGIGEIHPFTLIKRFTNSQKSKIIYAPDLAKFIKSTPEQVRALLMSLSTQGFLIYNNTEDNFYVTDRLYYYLDAKVGKTDYDVIQIESAPVNEKVNAKINLLNFDLTVLGVSQIQVSDSQNVAIRPSDKQIIMKANRDFDFSGRVNAGRFEYFGNNFSFSYDNFKIKLDYVDSMRMKVPGEEKDEYGNKTLVPVKSVVQYIKGDLLIDNPGNKSGVKDFPEYPIFRSFKDSYVFYDRSSIQRGVYKKDNFFFHLEPFVLDSLNSFDPSGLGLYGTFVSAGIFPEFTDSLRLQPDFSLGFIRPTPEEGFPVYSGKGTYLNKINLSNQGLRGDGELRYVTSVSKTDNFIFFPDSMNADVKDFEIKRQGKPIEFPPVVAQGVYEHWRPYKNRMWIYKKQFPLDFYDGQAFLEGNMELTPKELTGSGVMSFVKAELESKLFKFREKAFNSDTSNFKLKSDEASAFAFATVNVNSEIDFETRTGLFKSNGGASYVSFPVNQYICFMDQFKWFMDEKMVELSMGTKATSEQEDKSNIKLEGSEFISTNPDQDSLRWVAPYAKYNLNDYIIHAEQVKYILVADATIYPDSGIVTVLKRAKIETFHNSKIIANSTTKYHTIYNVTADILARKNYHASGDYDYIDIYNKKQTFHFSKITVDTTSQTYANSTIPDTSNFTLIPQINFKGEVTLNASRQYLNFSGYGKLNLQCPEISGSWFKFNADINPADVFIPLSSPIQDDRNSPLTASVSVFNDSVSYLYTSLMAPKRKSSDIALLTPEGYLFYDKITNTYKFGSKEKFSNKNLPGNYLAFNDNKCTTYGEGKINFGAETGQVKITSPGSVNNNMNNFNSDIQAMLMIDFFFAEDALKEMAENIQSVTTLVPSDNSRTEYEKGVAEILGKERAGKLIAELNLAGSLKKLPDEFLVPIFITDIKFEWNPENRSFISKGPVSLGNSLKYQINKQMQGQVEILKKKSGDILTVYLEADPANWYFFRYARGIMEAVSSNEKFNEKIRSLKADKRQAKSDKELGSYQFIISSERKKSDFLRKTAAPEGEEK